MFSKLFSTCPEEHFGFFKKEFQTWTCLVRMGKFRRKKFTYWGNAFPFVLYYDGKWKVSPVHKMKNMETEYLTYTEIFLEKSKKNELKILKVSHGLIIFDRRAICALRRINSMIFEENLQIRRKKQISFKAAAEFRFESCRFSRWLVPCN